MAPKKKKKKRDNLLMQAAATENMEELKRLRRDPKYKVNR